MKIKQKNINIGFLTIVLLLLTQTTKSEAAASTLFISDRESPAHLAFLEGQQRHYPAAYTLGDISWRRGSLTGFMALNGRSAHGSDAEITGQKQKTLQENPQPETYPLAGICSQADVIVAIGWEAAQGSKQECTVPLLAVFVTRVQTIELLEDSPRVAASAIYLEIDPILNLRLLAKMLPNATTIGVFVSPHSAAWLPHVRREAQQLQLRLEEIEATSDEEAVRELRTRIGNLDAVLLPPETSIINAWSLKPILLMSARHGVPTFGGLVEDYVEAGVTAAVVADLEHLHKQIRIFAERLAQGMVPPPAYPDANRVVINEIVARNMSIKTDRINW